MCSIWAKAPRVTASMQFVDNVGDVAGVEHGDTEKTKDRPGIPDECDPMSGHLLFGASGGDNSEARPKELPFSCPCDLRSVVVSFRSLK